jgi:hypothetical protein
MNDWWTWMKCGMRWRNAELWSCWTLKDIIALKQNAWCCYYLDSCMYDIRTCVRNGYVQNWLVIGTLNPAETKTGTMLVLMT